MGIVQDRLAGLSSSVAIKGPCRVATTTNITLQGLQTIDGVALAVNDRVLVKDQTDARENGIYYVDTGYWTRAKDFSRNDDVWKGAWVVVTDGAVAGSYQLATADVVFGETDIVFEVVRLERARIFNVIGYGAVCDGVTDDIVAIRRAVAACKASGGGTVVMPYVAGEGYVVSDVILIDFSNCVVLIEENITLTKTTATPTSFLSVFQIVGAPSAYIENVSLLAPYKVTLDGNGRNVVGFTHIPGATYSQERHHTVLVAFCRNFTSKNIYAYNGLIGCFTTIYSQYGYFENTSVSHAVYDNGITIGANSEHNKPYDATDPDTWNNTTLVNSYAWECANHGLNSGGAVGVTWINGKIWDCGNNTGTAGAGPAGGFGVEFDGTNVDRDYKVTGYNIQVYNSWGFGIRTNCRGTKIYGGEVVGTKIPTNYPETLNIEIWGSGIFVQGGATECYMEVDVIASERTGIRLANVTTHYPSLYFKGRIADGPGRAVWGIGIGDLVLDLTKGCVNNGTAGIDQGAILLNNGPANVDGGSATVFGVFNDNQYAIIQGSRIGTWDLSKGISGRNNVQGSASAFHAISQGDACQLLHAANINLADENGKQSRVLKFDSVVKAIIDRSSILGDQTNTGVPKAEITATTLIGDLIGSATYDPASVSAGAWGASTTITVTGANVGDSVMVSFSSATGLIWVGSVTAANTVTVAPFNPSGSPIDPGSNTLRAVVRPVVGP